MLTKKYFLLIPSAFGCRADEREGDINCNGFHKGSNHFESLKRYNSVSHTTRARIQVHIIISEAHVIRSIINHQREGTRRPIAPKELYISEST